MIPFDFEYYKPETIKEAVDACMQLEAEGKSPVYYGGGSELISMARVGNVTFGAAIDIKGIPECRTLAFDKDNLILGSALTLSDISEADPFPLLSKTAGRIADHTMQCKITLGGNMAATIIYRETIMPLLLTDCTVVVAGKDGLREYQINQIFHERLHLEKGEFVVKVIINKRFIDAPYIHVKKTRNEKIGYPLITTTAIKIDGRIRIAFSGLLHYPFRNTDIENTLNDSKLDFPTRANNIANTLSNALLNDLGGSAEFRKYVLIDTIINVLDVMRNK